VALEPDAHIQSDSSSLRAISEFLQDVRSVFATRELARRMQRNAELSGILFADFESLLRQLGSKEVQSIRWFVVVWVNVCVCVCMCVSVCVCLPVCVHLSRVMDTFR
jgi:hypothetical protein